MSAHRVLRDFFRAYESIGPGIGVDPGDAGTISPEMWGQQFPIKTAAAETRTLARPSRPGVLTSVVLNTDGGDLTLTVTGGYTTAGDTTIVFDTAGDVVVFLSVQTGTTYQWTVVSHEGANVAGTNVAPVRAVTATADGLTTGLLTTADFGRFLTVTSADADHILMLPAAGAAFIGGTIEMWVSATGFEVRANGTAATINGLDCKTTNEMAIAATHRVRFTLVAAETWLAEGDTELGARVTLVANAV